MDPIFRLSGAVRTHPGVEAWFDADDGPLRSMARAWFDRVRGCGPDVVERLHDGFPTACIGDAAFAYVAAFSAHVNLGFFHGSALPDPAGLLQGTGRRMRHVKLHWGRPVDEPALSALVTAAYVDIRRRVDDAG